MKTVTIDWDRIIAAIPDEVLREMERAFVANTHDGRRLRESKSGWRSTGSSCGAPGPPGPGRAGPDGWRSPSKLSA